MNMQARLPDTERLRLLGIMGVDVYVPRLAPLARAVAASPTHVSVQPPGTSTPLQVAAQVQVRGADAEEYLPLLAAILRSARLRRADWVLAGGSSGALPEWRFGDAAQGGPTPPALALPSLAELRASVSARRHTWQLLRTWVRRA